MLLVRMPYPRGPLMTWFRRMVSLAQAAAAAAGLPIPATSGPPVTVPLKWMWLSSTRVSEIEGSITTLITDLLESAATRSRLIRTVFRTTFVRSPA